MTLASTGLLLAVALVAGGLLQALARRLALPFNLVLLLAGFLFSEVVVRSGHDLGLRWYHFHDLVFALLLPLLVTASVARVEMRAFMREWRLVALISGPALLLALALGGWFIYTAFAVPAAFPFAVALAAAALFSATDPGDIIEQHGGLPACDRANRILEGESAVSDVIAVTLFAALLGSGMMQTAVIDMPALASALVWSGGVGLGAGFVVGQLIRVLPVLTRSPVQRGVLFAAVVFAAFVGCQYLFAGSGAVAALVAALVGRARAPAPDEREIAVMDALGWSARVLVFLLAGATFTVFMFREQWLAMLIALGAVTVARYIGIELALLPARWRRGRDKPLLDRASRMYLVFGGTRGAVVLALALSLPFEFEHWYTLQSMAYGVVLFTLALHPPAAAVAARRVRAG